MSRVAQAFDNGHGGPIVSASAKLAMLAAMLALAGCGAGGFSLEQAEVDRTIITSSAPPTPPPSDPAALSDQVTIRNAVSSADVTELAGKPVLWENSDTGSRGVITALAENRDNNQLCRRFTASRESFDGVALFKGEACLAGAGLWQMREFRAL